MARPGRPPSDYSFSKCVIKSALIWEDIEKAGLRGVAGVWCMEPGGGRLFNVVAIKQAYAGHAKQALLLTAGAHAGNYLGRFVVVVDDDIDPTNIHDVTWAMATRCDPAEDIDIVRNAWSGPLDPRRKKGDNYNSRALVDACRPFDWIDDFPPVAEASPEEKKRTLEKFGHLLKKL
jgi:4-hydroxy-3-polyprenylbenzoate decarboxylase